MLQFALLNLHPCERQTQTKKKLHITKMLMLECKPEKCNPTLLAALVSKEVDIICHFKVIPILNICICSIYNCEYWCFMLFFEFVSPWTNLSYTDLFFLVSCCWTLCVIFIYYPFISWKTMFLTCSKFVVLYVVRGVWVKHTKVWVYSENFKPLLGRFSKTTHPFMLYCKFCYKGYDFKIF